jgi:hypothetical protein
MANLLKKTSPSVHENTAQLVASQTLDDIGTADPYLKSNMRNHSVKRQYQHQPIESGYSTNGQRKKISLSSSWNSGEDNVDANDNQSDKGDLEQNSFEYTMDGMAMKSSRQYRNDRVSKSKREPNNSKMPIQSQRLNHENAHQKEQYCDGKHQIGQVLSNIETKNNHNTHTHTPSNEKAFYHSTNTPVANNNGNETLTRVKSVSLENYEASPERSCCIIS